MPSLLPQHWKGSGYINTWLRLVQVRRLINRIKPDIIDTHYITIYGYLGALSGFHPLVLTAWGSDVLIVLKESLWLRILVRYALRKAEMVICNSETVRRELIRFGVDPTKVRIIYQGVETQKFSPQRGKEFKDRLGLQGKPVVISIRNLKPVCNVEMLIRAIPLVLEHFPKVTFVIAGDGENGFLVPINDIQALANKIVYLLKNEEVGRKFSRLGRKIIQERAEYEREMERMEGLYQGIVAKD